jgi:hypothetical protein
MSTEHRDQGLKEIRREAQHISDFITIWLEMNKGEEKHVVRMLNHVDRKCLSIVNIAVQAPEADAHKR